MTYLPGFDFRNSNILRWYLPKINEFCTGDLLDSLVYLPCNIQEVLEADYGKKWFEDKPTSSYDYATAGQVWRGKKLKDDELEKFLVRPKATKKKGRI